MRHLTAIFVLPLLMCIGLLAPMRGMVLCAGLNGHVAIEIPHLPIPAVSGAIAHCGCDCPHPHQESPQPEKEHSPCEDVALDFGDWTGAAPALNLDLPPATLLWHVQQLVALDSPAIHTAAQIQTWPHGLAPPDHPARLLSTQLLI